MQNPITITQPKVAKNVFLRAYLDKHIAYKMLKYKRACPLSENAREVGAFFLIFAVRNRRLALYSSVLT
jgi:hypothetical protein